MKDLWMEPRGGETEVVGGHGRAGESGDGKMETNVFDHQLKKVKINK